MAEPVQVEVLDREGRPLARRGRRRLPSLANPFNWLLLLAALISAAAILLYATAEVARRRIRGERG